VRYFFLLMLLALVTVPVFGQSTTPYSQDCNKGDDEPGIEYLDCRGVIEGMLFIGTAVDTFEGDETLQYLNPQDSGDIRLRGIGGIEVGYRLFGNPQYLRPGPSSSSNNHKWDLGNLWIYTRVVHGARSTDALCTDQKNQQNPGCIQSLFHRHHPQTSRTSFTLWCGMLLRSKGRLACVGSSYAFSSRQITRQTYT